MGKFRQIMFSVKSFLTNWKFTTTVFIMTASAALLFVSYSIKTIRIVDEGDITIINTLETDYLKVLDANGIGYREEDRVDFSGFTGTVGEIYIERSFSVTLEADGKTHEVFVLDGAEVIDALNVADVKYRFGDILSVDNAINSTLEKPLFENEVVSIQRVDEEVKTLYEDIENETVVQPSNTIAAGTIKITQPGRKGKIEKVLSYRYIDGELANTHLVKETIVSEPQTELQLKGTVEAISPLDPFTGIVLDDTGRPANAVKVYENQVATAYSARTGAGTASGRRAAVGYVAVDPKVIPYGTKLFIETTSGTYIYGYAIAADTGTALMYGDVDIDLFFNTTEECRRFGRKTVRVYVLQ